ncbi:MAG: polyprenyl synthetase family protein [Phycisphaeraceae bacterium]
MILVANGKTTLQERLSTELAQVEALFAAEVVSDLACVNELVTHIERYRGKMLRPMLVLASGLVSLPAEQAAAPPIPAGLKPIEPALSHGHRVIATVVEMVHMATLVHDDILDEAQIRRKGATINQLNGNETAVMLGDYLISHAYHLCSSLGDPAVSMTIANATNTVCEGELLQLANRNNWVLDEATYFEIIRRKTASLCGTCCELGARLSGAEADVAASLYDFGEKVGIAFQIVDDLLDLMGDQDTVGKTLGRDVQKGKLTLPMIHHLARTDDSGRAQVLEILEDRSSMQQAEGLEADTVRRIRARLAATGSLAYAHECARRLVEKARQSLEIVAHSPARVFLLDAADAVLTRKY